MSAWELIRCPACGHDRVRPVEGKFVMPCSKCGQDEMEVYDLLPTLRDSSVPTPGAMFDRVLELRGGELGELAPDDRPVDRDPGPGPGARPETPAWPPAPGTSRRPVSQDMISIEPLLEGNS